MSLTVGNKSSSNANPGGSSYTWSHTQNTGDDRFLLVSVTMSSSVSFAGATYNGVAMAPIASHTSTEAQRWVAYGLLNPATGANNIVVSFSGAQWSSSSFFAVSFTNSSGAGNSGADDVDPTTNDRTLTVSANSVIFASALSANVVIGPVINGSPRTLEFQHNTNRQVGAALSATGLPGGMGIPPVTVNTGSTTGTVTNYRVEILEAAAPSGKDEGSFLPFFV